MSDKLGKTGDFPQGSIGADDEGGLRLAIAYDPVDRVVRINFGTPVAWLAMPPAEARELANLILKFADQETWHHD